MGKRFFPLSDVTTYRIVCRISPCKSCVKTRSHCCALLCSFFLFFFFFFFFFPFLSQRRFVRSIHIHTRIVWDTPVHKNQFAKRAKVLVIRRLVRTMRRETNRSVAHRFTRNSKRIENVYYLQKSDRWEQRGRGRKTEKERDRKSEREEK